MQETALFVSSSCTAIIVSSVRFLHRKALGRQEDTQMACFEYILSFSQALETVSCCEVFRGVSPLGRHKASLHPLPGSLHCADLCIY